MVDSQSPPFQSPGLDALIAKAVSHRQAGRLEDAAALFADLLSSEPNHTGLLLLAGETFFRLGRLHSARDMVSAALAAAPALPDGHFLLGRILTGLGQTADAV